MNTAKCRTCRRLGKKIFLKGAKCFSPKCAMIKRPFPPGQVKKNKPSITDYGREFAEKQKIKAWYGLRETQFKNYVLEVLKKLVHSKEKADDLLVRELEMRLDNTVLKLGFATSHKQARQIVSHSHLFVNNKKVNIPSFEVKKGDVITLAPGASKLKYFQNLSANLKKYNPPGWLKINADEIKGEVVGLPTVEEAALPAELSSVFEHYSK